MLKTYLLLPATLALALAWAAPAKADTILFDPDGTGAVFLDQQVDTFDWAVGNGLADGVNVLSDVGDTFTVYYQANLAAVTLAGGDPIFTQASFGIVGLGGDGSGGPSFADVYYTIVATFGEVITQRTVNPVDGTIDFNFGFDATQPSSFVIYVNDVDLGDNLTGVCFVCGTAVLTGTVSPIAYLSDFTGATLVPTGPLDDAGANNYPSVTTITGSGDFNINVVVDFAHPDYFTGLPAGSIITFGNFDGNTALPFEEADPSACFHSTAFTGNPTLEADLLNPANCTGGVLGGGVAQVAPENGVSQDAIMFQVDANSSFSTLQQEVIPEPATLTLLGIGLIGSAAARRRQKKARKQAQK